MDHQSGFAEINGTRLYYEMAGSGVPVALVHGLAADTRIWDFQFEPFAQHHQVIRYDLRGHGKSAMPTTESYSHADDLKALLDHLNIPQAHIMGQSLGGEIAIDFALIYPTATRSLVPVDSILGGYPYSQEWMESWGPIFITGQTDPVKAIHLLTKHPLLVPLGEKPEVMSPWGMDILLAYSGWHFANADPWRRPDPPAFQQLGNIKAPTLVIIGERTMPDIRAIADVLVRDIPNARKVIVPGVGHVVQAEAPDQLNQLALEFFASA